MPRLKIERIAYGGDGVGYLDDGRVCFVPFTAPGDEVEVSITQDKKRFARAQVEEIISPSEQRVDPVCPIYQECGGCQYQHLDYQNEFSAKVSQFHEVLKRLAGIDEAHLEEALPSPREYYYRNKLVLSPWSEKDSNTVRYGLHRTQGNHLVEVRQCALAREELNKLIPQIKRTPWGVRNKLRDKPKRATMRYASGSEDAVIFYGHAPEGLPWRHESVNGEDFSVPTGSFFQINLEVAEQLQKKVAQWIEEIDAQQIIDAYCGCGFLSMGIRNRYVTGLEIDEANAEAATYNSQKFALQGTHKYYAGNVEHMLRKYLKKKQTQNCVILDPPRGGCGEKTLKTLRLTLPEYILYVSCEASTLARDLKKLCECGYQLQKSAVFDMFPRTAHFESMVLLKKEK